MNNKKKNYSMKKIHKIEFSRRRLRGRENFNQFYFYSNRQLLLHGKIVINIFCLTTVGCNAINYFMIPAFLTFKFFYNIFITHRKFFFCGLVNFFFKPVSFLFDVSSSRKK